MRLWTLHPKYLDTQGLLALWREALLAQAVLSDQTKGYKHHPQLARFRQCEMPRSQIAHYLMAVWAEATQRGYRFNQAKIGQMNQSVLMPVGSGQLDYEWRHLRGKLKARSPDWMAGLPTIPQPEPHPLFQEMPGGIAEWEIGAAVHHAEH